MLTVSRAESSASRVNPCGGQVRDSFQLRSNRRICLSVIPSGYGARHEGLALARWSGVGDLEAVAGLRGPDVTHIGAVQGVIRRLHARRGTRELQTLGHHALGHFRHRASPGSQRAVEQLSRAGLAERLDGVGDALEEAPACEKLAAVDLVGAEL